MVITLKKIHLEYFKGIKDLSLNFQDGNNCIYGKNGSGKTTIVDAYTWLLFGRSSNGESDSKFTIKTLDKNNNVIPKVDHSVTAVIDVDGQEHTLERILRENWVKKKGSLKTEFTGNKTLYFFNDVPLSKSEYEQKISELISEDLFKLLSNPLEFPNRHWQDQRKILINIIGDINDFEIAKGNKQFEELLTQLSNKSFEEYKSQLSSQRKRLNDEIKLIPSRIDEQEKSKPEEVDFKALEKEYSELKKGILDIQDKIDDRNKQLEEINNNYTKISDNIHDLRSKNQTIEFETKNKVQQENKCEDLSISVKNKLVTSSELISKYAFKVDGLKADIKILEENIYNTSKQKEAKLKEWVDENAKELKIDTNDFNCPTCKRPLEADDIENKQQKILADFKSNKSKSLDRINREGLLLKEKLESLTKQKSELEIKIVDSEKYLEDEKLKLKEIQKEYDLIQNQNEKKPFFAESFQITKQLDLNKDYQNNLKEIERLKKVLENKESIDLSDLKTKRTELEDKLDEVKSLLSVKEQIEKSNERIKELIEIESKLAQQIVDIERSEFIAQEFTNTKINSIQERVNKMFPSVSFKMFDFQVNGGINETCKAIYEGVDFPDLNSASKLISGLEIISVLSDYYGVYCPIFLDNAESITDIPETKSQQIKLYVDASYPKLSVKSIL